MTAALNAADEGQLEWDRNLNPRAACCSPSAVLVGAGVIALAYNNVEGKLAGAGGDRPRRRPRDRALAGAAA